MKLLYAALVAAILLAGCAAPQPTPHVAELIKQHQLPVVGFKEVKAAMGDGFKGNAAIVDARSQMLYDRSHIPTAIFIAEGKVDAGMEALKKVAPELNSPIIIYCGGLSCEKSPLVGADLKARGYTNVSVYPGGMPEWEAKGGLVAIGTETAKKLFEEGKHLFIDARPQRLFNQGTITGSLNIPDTAFDTYKGRLPRDLNQPVVLFCQGLACEKSAIVAEHMAHMGYKNLSLYPAGFPGWKAANLPTTDGQGAIKPAAPKPAAATGGRIQEGDLPGTVSAAFMQELLKTKPQWLVIVDVRSADEYKAGHIPGAINIPSKASKEEFFAQLPKAGDDKEIILYCGTGARSFETADKLIKTWKHPLSKNIYALDATTNCDAKNVCTFK
ncbi:MAG: rhodanese-like domain-containing protein [Campylobacterales bacterium]